MSNLLPFPTIGEAPRAPGPPDAGVRKEALDIRRSFIVQAPAGSGKTALLIQRFLKLLADDSVTEPEQVLAITFTNAATAEMRDRVVKELEKAEEEIAQNVPVALAAGTNNDFRRVTLDLAHQVLARDHALAWQLLSHPHRLNIRTIDSVCTEIAQSLPVLSGSGGRLRPTEDAAPLHREAARRTLLLLGGGDAALDSALRDLLLHRDGNLDDCTSLLAEMLALRDQWGELVPLDRRELDDAWLDANLLPRLERTLQQAISSTLHRLDVLFPSDLLHELAQLAEQLGHLPNVNGEPSPVACCAGVDDPPVPGAAHLARWRALIHLLVTAGCTWRQRLSNSDLKIELDKNDPRRTQIQNILNRLCGRDDLLLAIEEVRELPGAEYPANQWAVAKSLFRVLSHALVELQLVFAEHNQCDFTELNLLARYALRAGPGPGDLASALGARMQHLLVDEMQDTSTGQYELLELLTASWDGHSQTVFLVGDPCQSIYLFRQACVERFLQALETCRLGEIPLTPVALTANFRSQRKLVDQFNDDFKLIFPSKATDHDGRNLQYIRAEATQPASSTADGRVWHANPQLLSSSASPGADGMGAGLPTQAHRDAESIATVAEEWLKRPLPSDREEPWRMAVLVRSRNHLAEVVPALRRKSVPFRAIDIETLRDRQEVLDLAALTRALLHPADRVAAFAVLRAPWCGLPLADLHTLAGADDFTLSKTAVLRLMEERAHLLPIESQRRLARVQDVLRAAAPIRSRVSAAQLVERAWRTLGGDASLTPPEIANARRFFELLDRLEASGGELDATHIEDRLTQLYAEPDPLPASTGFVELLTIHKAKGLEWDVVFVPALERQAANGPARALTWAVLDELDDTSAAPIMLAPIAARGEEVDALTCWLKRRDRARDYAENKRLFYVACTRARQELHLFAAPDVTSSGVSSGAADSLLKAAWPAAAPNFVNRPGAARGEVLKQSATAQTVYRETGEIHDIAAGADRTEDGSSANHLAINDLGNEAQAIDANLIPPVCPVLRRLPLNFDPVFALTNARTDRLPYGDASPAVEGVRFVRPEGSFAARSFGNTIHACIERITAKIAAGASPASVLAELPSWSARVTALLRADGLSAAMVARLARDGRTALQNLLSDPDGQWLVSPHSRAASEFALTASRDSGGASPRPVTVRADRVFLAGSEAHSSGATHLWIIDYKTASHGAAKMDEFLNAQRATYSPQLEMYARILAPVWSIPFENVRVALYFPALSRRLRLIWWQPSELECSSNPEAAELQTGD
jgi:ATP-dependent helicase/nuclease subunit A